MQEHHELIRSTAGTTKHIEEFLDSIVSNGGQIPRITLAEALAIPEIGSAFDTWQFAIDNDPSKGRALTGGEGEVLIDRLNGAVWLTEMDHLSVPFYRVFAPSTGYGKAL